MTHGPKNLTVENMERETEDESFNFRRGRLPRLTQHFKILWKGGEP